MNASPHLLLVAPLLLPLGTLIACLLTRGNHRA